MEMQNHKISLKISKSKCMFVNEQRCGTEVTVDLQNSARGPSNYILSRLDS